MTYAHLFIVSVIDDGETFNYEYGNIEHARQHYNNEKHATLLEYKDGNHYMIDCK